MVDRTTKQDEKWPKPVCHCLPGCNEINYSTAMTYGALEPEFVAMKGYLTEPFNATTFK